MSKRRILKLSKKPERPEDSELLEKYLGTGDLEWLGELYNRYIHLVYGVCLKYFREREASKDAVNQIFEKLIEEIPKFEIQSFRSWLYVVVRNHCLMELRKDQTTRKQFERFSAEYYMESTQVLHPIDEERDESMEEQLRQCMEKLKEEQQESIRLFYFEKKCYEEIARTMGVDQKKVKSLIQNGKRNLKICMEQLVRKE